jgi:cell division ATPase FtsA
MNTEQPIIVGLDIGTTKIAVIAEEKMNLANWRSWVWAVPTATV